MAKLYRKLSFILASDVDLKRRKFSLEDYEENDEATYTEVSGDGPLTIAASGTKVITLPVSPTKALIIQVTGDVGIKINGAAAGIQCKSVGTIGGVDFVSGFLMLTTTAITSLEIDNNSSVGPALVEIGYAG